MDVFVRNISRLQQSFLHCESFHSKKGAIEHYGVRGVVKDWFVSYLRNRRQFTSVGIIHSDDLPISYGVPQGSVQGALLFLVYINDFSNCTDTLRIFAHLPMTQI